MGLGDCGLSQKVNRDERAFRNLKRTSGETLRDETSSPIYHNVVLSHCGVSSSLAHSHAGFTSASERSEAEPKSRHVHPLFLLEKNEQEHATEEQRKVFREMVARIKEESGG
jgi:hypothetical protein